MPSGFTTRKASIFSTWSHILKKFHSLAKNWQVGKQKRRPPTLQRVKRAEKCAHCFHPSPHTPQTHRLQGGQELAYDHFWERWCYGQEWLSRKGSGKEKHRKRKQLFLHGPVGLCPRETPRGGKGTLWSVLGSRKRLWGYLALPRIPQHSTPPTWPWVQVGKVKSFARPHLNSSLPTFENSPTRSHLHNHKFSRRKQALPSHPVGQPFMFFPLEPLCSATVAPYSESFCTRK